MGVEIAKAVIESILPYQGSWIQERGVLTQYHSVVNQSEQITNEFRQCLNRFLINNGLTTKEIAHLTSLEAAKSLSAIKIAHTVSKILKLKPRKVFLRCPIHRVYVRSVM